ncbi:hypothetical protein [Micromonospora sp. WMMA1996]|uniref:hypothetical protein n=1 Tax=Micromonospora sp. WMMA1996 TaxID=2039878 RepID=UPI0011459B7A|nr:hypothetical protein [Micromonospora sp. WMMA1996]
MVGLVVTVVAALVLAFCGCVGLGVLGAFVDDSTSAGEPYDDPYLDDPYLDDPDGIADEPTPTVPVTTPSGGPGRFTVVYEVTATGPVDVQFYDAGENLLHLDDVASPGACASREQPRAGAGHRDPGRTRRRRRDLPDHDRRPGGVPELRPVGARTCFGW